VKLAATLDQFFRDWRRHARRTALRKNEEATEADMLAP
jgi:hypothetical protein